MNSGHCNDDRLSHEAAPPLGNEPSRGRRAVFLDRDGVVNRTVVRQGKPFPPSNLDELAIPPGTVEALRRLKAAGFRLVVVTNQPDVARGTQTREAVEAIHRWLQVRLPLDEFRACYHDDADDCQCRKPRPGMLLAAARENGLDLAASFMIGDRWRDVEAGRRAGCRPIFLDLGYEEKQPDGDFMRVRSLAEAADWILTSVATATSPPTQESRHLRGETP